MFLFEVLLFGMFGVGLVIMGLYYKEHPEKLFKPEEKVQPEPAKMFSLILMIDGVNIIISTIYVYLVSSSIFIVLIVISAGTFFGLSIFFFTHPNTIWWRYRYSREWIQPGKGTAVGLLIGGVIIFVFCVVIMVVL